MAFAVTKNRFPRHHSLPPPLVDCGHAAGHLVFSALIINKRRGKAPGPGPHRRQPTGLGKALGRRQPTGHRRHIAGKGA
eukprot:2207098-Heterocapsa_arctica.AAC.1